MRLIAWALLILAPLTCQAQESFTFSNAAGPYGVGVRVVEQYDKARAFPGPAASGQRRPIQTVVWYPAKRGGKPWVFDNYLHLIGSADDFSRPASERQRFIESDIAALSGGKSDPQIAAARVQPMWAVPDAPSEPGKFPVVIYAPSFGGDAAQNADLCEYLASYGYVVMASPSMGKSKRNFAMNIAGLETQAADIRFLIGYASSLEQVDGSKIAVIGYSSGGLANIFAAAKDKRITALVQLDGSVRYFNSLVKKAKYVTPKNLAIPLLYLAHRPLHDAVENQIKYEADLSGSLINGMQAADLYLFNINALDHRDFSSWFIRARELASFEDYSPAEVSAAYGWMSRYVLEFLNAYTKSDPQAKTFLSVRPEANGVPSHLIETVIRQQK